MTHIRAVQSSEDRTLVESVEPQGMAREPSEIRLVSLQDRRPRTNIQDAMDRLYSSASDMMGYAVPGRELYSD